MCVFFIYTILNIKLLKNIKFKIFFYDKIIFKKYLFIIIIFIYSINKNILKFLINERYIYMIEFIKYYYIRIKKNTN